MTVVLWILAAVLAVWGLVALFSGDVLWGLLLIVLACAAGPGGWSVFGRR